MSAPVVVFDSGFGGLSVLEAIRARGLRGPVAYLADQAGFPYGARADADVIGRVVAVVGAAIDQLGPSAVVIACNTASTLALPILRSRWPIAFVGVVPAIKPAAAATRSGLISVLATPGTVARDYTKALIAQFAADKRVTLVGAGRLAGLAEAFIAGEAIDLDAVRAEIAPAFVDHEGARTDAIALACTHFPLLRAALAEAAPWPVAWIDPGEAIARRLETVAPAWASAPAAQGAFISTRPPTLNAALIERLAGSGLAVEAAPWLAPPLST